jgi:hypothetical protein
MTVATPIAASIVEELALDGGVHDARPEGLCENENVPGFGPFVEEDLVGMDHSRHREPVLDLVIVHTVAAEKAYPGLLILSAPPRMISLRIAMSNLVGEKQDKIEGRLRDGSHGIYVA